MITKDWPKVQGIAVGTERGNATLFLYYCESEKDGVSERRIKINTQDMVKLAKMGFHIRNV